MQLNKYLKLGALASLGLLASCGGSDLENKEKDLLANDSADVPVVSVSREVLDNMLQTIPSPVEMSSIIKASGNEFDAGMLNPTANTDKYTNKYQQALALGAYGADLGYINIYEKTFYVIDYLKAIRQMADGIKVGQYFDFKALSELSKNSKNVDSLLLISTRNFNKIDQFLRDQNRGELSVLILTGAWIEGLHVSTKIIEKTPTEDMQIRLGEQKVNVDNIYAILKAYEAIPYFKGLKEKVEDLKKVYDGVTITIEYGAPTTKEVDGQLVIEDNSKSIVKITKEQVDSINKLTASLRQYALTK